MKKARTVKELIDELKKYNPDMKVVIVDYAGCVENDDGVVISPDVKNPWRLLLG